MYLLDLLDAFMSLPVFFDALLSNLDQECCLLVGFITLNHSFEQALVDVAVHLVYN